MLGAPLEQLAGAQRDQLRGAKMPELLAAARSGTLTAEDVATFAQSVHPSLLAQFERGAKLPSGFFLSTTRAVQFPGGNPYLGPTPTPKQAARLRRDLTRKLTAIVSHHRARGGRSCRWRCNC